MNVLADLRFALRILLSNPGFAIVAVLALGLGLGTNTMVFAIYNGAILKTVPFDKPEQVILVSYRNVAEGWRFSPSYPDFLEFRQQAKSVSALATYSTFNVNVSSDNGFAESLSAARITSNTFPLIG